MKSHRTDVVSLVFGMLFLAVAGWWAASYYLNWVLNWHVPRLGWITAAGLILLGLLGVLATLRRDRPDPLDLPPAGGDGRPNGADAVSMGTDALSMGTDGPPTRGQDPATRGVDPASRSVDPADRSGEHTAAFDPVRRED